MAEQKKLEHVKLKYGTATEMWLELVPARDTERSLWLLVDDSWLKLNNPKPEIQQAVQDAFCCANSFQVVVWYESHSQQPEVDYHAPTNPRERSGGAQYGTEIKGLVIRSISGR